MTEKPQDDDEQAKLDEEEFARIYAESEHVPLAQVKDELGLPVSDEERAELELMHRETSDTEPPVRGESVPMPEIPPPPDEPLSQPPPDATPGDDDLDEFEDEFADEPEHEAPASEYEEPADLRRVVVSPMPTALPPSSKPIPTARQVAGQKHVSAKGSKRTAGTGSRLLKKDK